jgi:hypothetical protein
MTAINSNRAIRGPVTAVPVVAGKGVRLVADTVNNRWVVEADETVLWENSAGESIGANQYITLSESLKNFERVIIYYALQSSWGGKLTYELVGVNGNTPFCLNQFWYREQSGYNNYWETITFNKYDDATLRITNNGGEQGPIHSTSWTTTSGLVTTMYKVVGINRVASA